MFDSVENLIKREEERQSKNIELIASENFVSDRVMRAVGSCFTNKYAEGYPEKVARETGKSGRYYGGCDVVDELEELCCHLWKEAFRTDYHVNVQPHSGTNANFAAYLAVLKPGDTILSMSLDDGAHLSHGSSVNLSGKLFNIVNYGVDENGFIDYNDLEKKLRYYRPQLVLAGASAYSRIIDFQRIKNIIDSVQVDGVFKRDEDYRPYFMVDMAHIAGLVCAGVHPSPFGLADIVTTTTQKTLRGPRGGLIFCRPNLAKKIDAAVFPGLQGGPLMHVIAGKAVCAEEAMTQEYIGYIQDVVANASVMAEIFVKLGYHVITGGTDNHLFLIDLTTKFPTLTGREVQDFLDTKGITLNKNCVPNERRSPMEASGLRIGTAAMTTKGWKKEDFIRCAFMIDCYLIELAIQKAGEN